MLYLEPHGQGQWIKKVWGDEDERKTTLAVKKMRRLTASQKVKATSKIELQLSHSI
ncbi:hypothetical protein CLOSTMETH_03542 [[Clostridium] methylpentosum DSM 5476]|uniref:Uncharacterized protein n=1 Tax=[Clostridium] methylpentosum DSM 5476 TaxID=537013 RepID=C0EI47_9FIRM|nr:hypothetical protein CLOSTMETH_03542 [[Clostridium] methylpentosum DSM 5476]